MPTYTIFADSASGKFGTIRSNDGGRNWTTVMNGSSLTLFSATPTTAEAVDASGANKTSAFKEAEQVFLQFDCSSVPSTDTVTAVTLSLHTTGGQNDTASSYDAMTYAYATALATASWRTASQLAALTRLASLASQNPFSTAYQSFTENGTNFQSAINKGTGAARTQIVIAHRFQESNSTPPGSDTTQQITFDHANASSNQPKLVITTTAAATSSPPISNSRFVTVQRAATR